MKKVLFYILAITMVVLSSCVSQAQYNQLKRKYETESLRYQYEIDQYERGERNILKKLKSFLSKNNEAYHQINILEREVNKTIRVNNDNLSDCFELITDSAGVYSTFFAIDSASTVAKAMVKAYDRVQDSVIALGSSIIDEAIHHYKKVTKLPFDTLAINWRNMVQNTCHDVWKDSTDTYWAVEVQRIYWSEFVDTYIAETLEEEASDEEGLIIFENSESKDLFKDTIKELKAKLKRKLNVDLFREKLNTAITNKTILTEDAEKP